MGGRQNRGSALRAHPHPAGFAPSMAHTPDGAGFAVPQPLLRLRTAPVPERNGGSPGNIRIHQSLRNTRWPPAASTAMVLPGA
jgi:hypothetical protein